MPIDPAILALLPLDPSATNTLSRSSGGGGSGASTSSIISSLPDGTTQRFFLKTSHGEAAATMFAGEHASLNALSAVVPSLCPRSFGHGRFSEDSNRRFIVTEWINFSSRSARSTSSSSTSSMSLAQKLAKLHTTPAPIPEGYTTPQFGFPVPTCCGEIAQDNTLTSSWADFYAHRRLRAITAEATRRQGQDGELTSLVEQTCSKVVPRLLSDGHLNNGKGVIPVVVHGDLWSGNTSRGVLSSSPTSSASSAAPPEDLVFDASAFYAHSEYELGIMRMFGGFGAGFQKEYHSLVPKTEPVDEYEHRVRLYELFHHLNHFAMFGGGYRSGAVGIMRELVGRYGGG